MKTGASPSWNGFSFQGKITIYQVLKRINDEKLDMKTADRYSIRTEGIEDYDLFEHGKIIELGQVKAKLKDNNISDYSDAISTLLLHDEYQKNNSINLTFHSATHIHDWESADFKTPISNLQEKVTTLCNKIIILQNEIDTTQSLTKKEIEKKTKALEMKEREAKKDKKKLHGLNKFISNRDCITLVKYPKEKGSVSQKEYCDLSIINDLLDEEIETYFKWRQRKSWLGEKSIERHRYALICFLNDHINDKHKKIATTDQICFTEFIEMLETNRSEPDDLYVYGKIIDRFNSIEYHPFCESDCLKKINCKDEDCFLTSIFAEIASLELEDGFKLIRHCFPHIIIDDLDEHNYRIDSDGILFLYELFEPDMFSKNIEIKGLPFTLESKDAKELYFTLESKDAKELYFPTGIKIVAERKKEGSLKKYRCNIITNINRKKAIPIETAYELNGFITDNLKDDDILCSWYRSKDDKIIKSFDNDDPRPRRNTAKLSLIPFESLKKEGE